MPFRIAFLVGLFLVLLLSIAPRAYACSCGSVTDPDAFVAEAGAIFEGTVVEKTVVEKAPSNISGGMFGTKIEARFKVFTAYKGAIGPDVVIRHIGQDGVNCGAAFTLGEKETIILFGDAIRGYTTSMCGQAAIANSREEILAAAARYRERLMMLHKMALYQGPWAQIQEAEYLAAHSEPAEALALIDEILKDESLRRRAILLAADVNAAIQQDEAALARLDSYLTDFPYDREIQQYRIRELIRLGRADQVPENWRDFSDLSTERLDFRDRDLAGASFRAAEAEHADFAKARLDHADFSGATLFDADFSGATLNGANLRGARLVGPAPGASLANAALDGARIGLDLSGGNLENVQARGTSFEGKSLSKVKAAGLIAVGGKLGGDLRGGDFQGADFSGATFSSPDFRDADLRNADFTDAVFGSQSQPGNLSGADLTGAKLDRVSFSPTVYDCKTRWPAGFDPARLSNLIAAADAKTCGAKRDFSWLRPQDRYLPDVSFAKLDLSGVSFRGSILPGNKFIGANLRGADFSRSSRPYAVFFQDADLTDAKLNFVDLEVWQLHGEGALQAPKLDGTDFRGAILYLRTIRSDVSADLSRAKLSGVIFADDPAKWPVGIDPVKAGVVFRKSRAAMQAFPAYSLKGSDLRGFNLYGFDLAGMDLSGADLRGSRLDHNDLTGTKLSGAKLKGACWYDVKWPAGFSIAGSGAIYCGGANFTMGYDAPLWAPSRGKKASPVFPFAPAEAAVPDFTGENWDEAYWLAAWLPGSNMSKGSFVHATLRAANLTGAKLAEADLSGADLRDALLERADLTGASLAKADLRLTSLTGANLAGTDLTGALYDAKTVWPDAFDPDKAGAVKAAQN